jgi:hypothetical protein
MSDPLSGTNTRNVIQHIFSPKIVTGPTGGYSVKTDVINVDNVYNAGALSAGSTSLKIGYGAGYTGQQSLAIAIGNEAGYINQASGSIAIGSAAGSSSQATNSIAIGRGAATELQGDSAIAIGLGAGGISQGSNAVAIGSFAGPYYQSDNTIILNASGSSLNATGSAGGFFVKPVREIGSGATGFSPVLYNPTTGEIGNNTEVGPTTGISATPVIIYTSTHSTTTPFEIDMSSRAPGKYMILVTPDQGGGYEEKSLATLITWNGTFVYGGGTSFIDGANFLTVCPKPGIGGVSSNSILGLIVVSDSYPNTFTSALYTA